MTPTHVLRTHSHADHVVHEAASSGCLVARQSLETGDLWIEAIPTPGHSDDMVAFVVNDAAVFSGDTLFKDAVGGGDYEQVRASVMDVFMPMPHDRPRPAGSHRRDDDRPRVGGEPVRARLARRRARGHRARDASTDRDATLIVWSPDYDGKGKAWVRFEDGADAIVGGSRVERS